MLKVSARLYAIAPLALVGVLALGLLPTTGCGKAEAPAATVASATPAEALAIPVTVEKVTPRPVQRIVYVSATIHGLEEVIVTPEVEGIVKRIHHEVGDRVKPGEILVELNPINYRLAVNEAIQALQLELARLGLKELPAEEFDVTKLPGVVRADRLVENARRRLARVESLFGRKVATEEDFDQARTDFQVAQATLQQTIDETEATIASARLRAATLASAQERLDDTSIYAPDLPTLAPDGSVVVDYVVAERMVAEGEMVRAFPSRDMFRLVVDHPLKVRARVSERNLAAIREGQTLKLKIDAYPSDLFDGKIVRVYPTIDRASRTFQIEAIVPNEDRRLKPGVFAKGGVLTELDENAPTVPLDAVVTFAGVTKVFVVRDNKAYAVEVQLGETGEGWIEIKGDFDPESTVVTSGQTKLADGTPVRIREPETPEMARREP
ncbi:MAG: efflux RND transporter periplasmic adaptor subunit [Pirellulales bacterium]|nr:efflux RND transporter periplasmic adaptor subunit [Pirellulales bacterium]